MPNQPAQSNGQNVASDVRPVPGHSPWTFIPTVYFAEGLPYVLINSVSVVMLKRMGIDNATITLWTSFLYLPWMLKMFWGPLVDARSTKRNWILMMQAAMSLCFMVVAFSLHLPAFFLVLMVAFFAGAFISATHDIAIDGFYLLALTDRQQSLFVGIRAACFRVAMVFGQGGLVWLAGRLEIGTNNIPFSWSTVYGVGAALFLLMTIYHRFILPFPAGDGRVEGHTSNRTPEISAAFTDVFRSYFRQPGIAAIIAFILFYRVGESFLVKLATPFFLDGRSLGGLGLTTSEVGIVYGTIGVSSLLTGGILGGILIERSGLRHWLWPMAIVINLPAFIYVFLSTAQPGIVVTGALVALEQFCYGFGFAAFSVYLMFVAKGKYSTSHYAISTGLMALGMILPGSVSGALQQALGYQSFFILTAALSVLSLATLFRIPLPRGY